MKTASPYVIDRRIYRRFHQKNICFSRVRWDESFVAYGRGIYDRAESKMDRGLKGHTREEYAAMSAAWSVHDTLPHSRGLQLGGSLTTFGPISKPAKAQANPKRSSDFIKRFARDLGAQSVGTTRLNLDWVYSHDIEGNPLELGESVRFAIVFLIPMDQRMLAESPRVPASTAVGLAYSLCRIVSESLARCIAQLGYKAYPAVNELALSVPLAIDAGLGEFGRNGLLISGSHGMAVRIGKVLTDMPLTQDPPVNLGVRRFCRICKRCAEKCPAKAISFDEEPSGKTFSISNNPGIEKWYVNVDRCYEFWCNNGTDCSNCITHCPFTKPDKWSHRLARGFIRRTGLINRLLLRLDRFYH
ncbi:MAG: reductive dehalogenase [Thermoplasmata archaeon]